MNYPISGTQKRKYPTLQNSEKWNIVAIVGNGFDLQVGGEYNERIRTSFTEFYKYLKLHHLCQANPIVDIMEHARNIGHANWASIEELIQEYVYEGELDPAKRTVFSKDGRRGRISVIKHNLPAIQESFLAFLRSAVPNDLMDDINRDSQENGWARRSLSSFEYDIVNYGNWDGLPIYVGHHSIVNYTFVNFNYTTLLDTYIYLDQVQFDPSPYRSSNNNFPFGVKQYDEQGECISDEVSSVEVRTEVIHPHGVVGIPRSMLLGIDEKSQEENDNDDDIKYIQKPYWGQNNIRFGEKFTNADLFILFGCSLGVADKWWWKKIKDSMVKCECESMNHSGEVEENPSSYLVIYSRSKGDSELQRQQILDKFRIASDASDEEWSIISKNICVVIYPEMGPRYWLSTDRNRNLSIVSKV